MAYANKDNPDCANCNKSGLAILPVRYAVVPNHVDATLPTTLGNKVVDVKLKHHKYALRTLRQGFLYLFYEKHARGSHIKWEVYSVSSAGTLWKQLSINAIEVVEGERCSRKEHRLPASVIAIESPEKCGKVWMAFSEHAWSTETFEAFEADTALRDRRMQTFAPAVWIKSRDYRHGIETNEQALNDIIEYKSGFPLSTLGRNNVVDISKPDGSYDSNGLKSCATRYAITVRRDDKMKLVDMMKKVGEVPNKPGYAPIIIALWDNLGIAHELNGYRNDATGWIEKYGQERELEIGALGAIEGAKKALKDRSRNKVISAGEAGIFKWSAEFTQRRIENYEKFYPGNAAGLAREKDLCERWERDATARIPSSIARRREAYTHLRESDWRAGMAEVDKAGKSMVQRRDETIENWANEEAARAEKAWSKYESKLDKTAFEIFKARYTEFITAASKLADERTEDVVVWMKSTHLQNALLEYHPSNLNDGVAFEDAVGDTILGVSSSPAGLAIVEEWIGEARSSDNNLLWRAIALNQSEGISAVNGILTAAATSKDVTFTETALNAARESTKYIAKLADLVKKSLSLHNTLKKGEILRVPTGGIEKLLMTIGHLFFQPFVKKGADLLAEKFILGLLLARSGAEYSKIMGLLAAEAKFGKLGRAETLLVLLSMGHVIANRNTSRGFKTLEDAWKALAKDADTPKTNSNPKLAGGFNEAKEMRFAMVATIAQMTYVAKLYLDAENDPQNKRIQAELWIAELSLSAGLADLGATAIKGLHKLKDGALGFQALKLAGGVLSAGSAWIQYQQDREKSKKNYEMGQITIARLYRIKSWVGLMGGASSVLTAVSYTKPAFEMIAAKFPETMLGRASASIPRFGSFIAGRLLIGRAIVMFGGIWFSIATVAIQIIIWKFSDDKLQEWCELSAFGNNKEKRIKNPQQQMNDFQNALLEVI
jgi:hypothetical protein